VEAITLEPVAREDGERDGAGGESGEGDPGTAEQEGDEAGNGRGEERIAIAHPGTAAPDPIQAVGEGDVEGVGDVGDARLSVHDDQDPVVAAPPGTAEEDGVDHAAEEEHRGAREERAPERAEIAAIDREQDQHRKPDHAGGAEQDHDAHERAGEEAAARHQRGQAGGEEREQEDVDVVVVDELADAGAVEERDHGGGGGGLGRVGARESVAAGADHAEHQQVEEERAEEAEGPEERRRRDREPDRVLGEVHAAATERDVAPRLVEVAVPAEAPRVPGCGELALIEGEVLDDGGVDVDVEAAVAVDPGVGAVERGRLDHGEEQGDQADRHGDAGLGQSSARRGRVHARAPARASRRRQSAAPVAQATAQIIGSIMKRKRLFSPISKRLPKTLT
jgi:hypothetical protein